MKTKGEKLAFKLGEMAPNILTPFSYGELLLHLGFTDVSHTESVGCGAVGLGSTKQEQGHLMEKVLHKGDIALVGKGITFDTGGYSIKAYQHMVGMKYDMMGSAVVLGAMIDLENDVHSLQAQLCIAENRVSSTALMPDSEIIYADGTTVIVTDTDAEGRLVLADGIIRAKKNGAKVIVTVATLTGACVAALGADTVGVFASSDSLASKALSAINSTKTIRGWRMPFLDDKAKKKMYKGKKLINWKHARDLPGHSYAASFLQHFAGDTPFIHLDIAGVATVGEHDKARTEMVIALTRLVEELS